MNDSEAFGLRLVADHIHRVRQHMGDAIDNLHGRSVEHDRSKYSDEESALVVGKPYLDSLEYGSAEYYRGLDSVKAALQSHYERNSHHPEHYADGVAGMSLFDMIEMLCDWKAAGELSGGSIEASIVHNAARFNLTHEIVTILRNTAREMGWSK